MKLHDTYLSEVIKEYKDIVPKVLCKELIEFFEESITFRVDIIENNPKKCNLWVIQDHKPWHTNKYYMI